MRAVTSVNLMVAMLMALGSLQAKEAVAPTGGAVKAASMERLQASALGGNPEAQYELARRYGGQAGDMLDLPKAYVYTRQAAEHGHRAAQVDLGFAYYNGNGQLPKDLALSFQWFRKAAQGGAVIAQCMLGDFYKDGLGGVKRDPAAAFGWYRRTATQSDRCAPKSQYELYVSYETGQGVKRDLKTATTWLEKAAAAGNPQAQATLGRNYATGHGVNQDLQLAKFWRRKSREGVSAHEDHEHVEQAPRPGATHQDHKH